MRVLLRASAVFAVLTLASSWAAAQSTVYVDDNSTCPGAGTIGNPYCRIQDAICALRSTGGGTVMVKPGTYNEAVRMFFGVSVVSTDGPLATTINPTSPALKPCITSTCTVSTTTPCAAVYFPSSAGGGGSTNADRLEGFTITGGRGIRQTCSGTCDAQAGGGLFILNSSPTITRNTISGNVLDPNNTATNVVFRGGGIYVGSSAGTPSRPVISLNTIEGNIADSAAGTNSRPNFTCGGGIYVDENSAPRIEANLVRNNRSGLASKAFQWAGGGGIAVYTNTGVALPRTVVTRNQIAGNQAADGGGGIAAAFLYTYPSNARIENNLIEQNTADEGGGMVTMESAAEIVNNTITDNTAAGGAGILFGNAPHALNLAKLSNNLITFNIASIRGGGAYLNPTLVYELGSQSSLARKHENDVYDVYRNAALMTYYPRNLADSLLLKFRAVRTFQTAMKIRYRWPTWHPRTCRDSKMPSACPRNSPSVGLTSAARSSAAPTIHRSAPAV